jgi:hypothetical protein
LLIKVVEMNKMLNKDKKALSGVIAALLMVALVMAASSIVWVVINNLVKERLTEARSCFGVYEKIKINSAYTCFNTSSRELQFSIGVEDIEVNNLLVSISGEGQTRTFDFKKDGISEEYLRPYKGEYGDIVKPPEKNSGETYVLDTVLAGLEYISVINSSIQVAPIMGKQQCRTVDSLNQIDDCLYLA